MPTYFVTVTLHDWNSDVGSFSDVVKVDFEVDDNETLERLNAIIRKKHANHKGGGYSYNSMSITNLNKIKD